MASLQYIGSCTLHIAHNALKTGLSAVQHWGVEEFVLDIFTWFKNFPARCEDYEVLHGAMSNDDIGKKFKRFVDNRWLSLGPVIDRILQQFDILREFFLKGKLHKAVKENSRFKRICPQLKFKETTTIHLHVARSVCSDMKKFGLKKEDAQNRSVWSSSIVGNV